MDVPHPPPLDLNITVQQFMSLMTQTRPLPGSMPETPVMRSIMTLMQIVKVAHTPILPRPGVEFPGSALRQNMDQASLNRINCMTKAVMASVVKMDEEQYKFSPVVEILLTTKGVFRENPVESIML